MSNLLILAPYAPAAIAASRGTNVAALLTADPKEAWTDSASGTAVTIDIDLGTVRPVDTVFVGFAYGAAAAATWSISGGAAGYGGVVLKGAGLLSAPAATADYPGAPHAVWTGAVAIIRYVRVTLVQPAGGPPLRVGVVSIGQAFVPDLNKEWGSGRQPIDLSRVTELPNGGFAIVEGARKRSYSWTLGDLSEAEMERLDAIALDRGESKAALVIEDPVDTPGLRNRMHFGLMRWRRFDRRNRRQIKWELEILEWV